MRERIRNVLHWASDKLYTLGDRVYTEPRPIEVPWVPGFPLLQKLPEAYWTDPGETVTWSNKYLVVEDMDA